MRALAAVVLCASFVGAQAAPTATPAPNVLPDTARAEQFVVSADGRRTYYTTAVPGIWLYDREGKTTVRLTTDVTWDLTLSQAGSLIAYSKTGANRRTQNVWALPLSVATGLASGKERRISTRAGDSPSISPDGKSIAFARDDSSGVGQTLVVVPSAGGTERVLATGLTSGISGIRWTPDGVSIYYGLNAPVPLTCAESCLTGARDLRPLATVRRVPRRGGTSETIATVLNPLPGLSPDGKLLVYRDTGSARQVVVTDAAGKRLQAFAIPNTQAPAGWLAPSTLLTMQGGVGNRLSAVSISGGPIRTLAEVFGQGLAWGPDSKSVSFAMGPGCTLRIMNADGSSPRSVPLAPTGFCFSATPTADPKFVAYMSGTGRDTFAIAVANVETGKSQVLRTLDDYNTDWLVDGNVVVIATVDRAGGGRRVTISEFALTGESRTLHEMPLEAGERLVLVDRTRAILVRAREKDARLVRRGGGVNGDITLVSAGAATFESGVWISADHEWAAFKLGATAGGVNRVELVRLDGSARRTISVPFVIQPNSGVAVLPDGKGVVLVESRRPGEVPGIYHVDASGSAKRLAGYTAPAGWPTPVLSPDGSLVAWFSNEIRPTTVSAYDLSKLSSQP